MPVKRILELIASIAAIVMGSLFFVVCALLTVRFYSGNFPYIIVGYILLCAATVSIGAILCTPPVKNGMQKNRLGLVISQLVLASVWTVYFLLIFILFPALITFAAMSYCVAIVVLCAISLKLKYVPKGEKTTITESKIELLKKLLADGTITQEEYKALVIKHLQNM